MSMFFPSLNSKLVIILNRINGLPQKKSRNTSLSANIVHGVKLYTFKYGNDIIWKLSEKLLQHFYSLWDIIFGAI